MLSDFFRINLPYGMKKNENNEWSFFNREYVPLGWNSTSPEFGSDPFPNLPIHTRYTKLNEATLLKLSWGNDGVRRNSEGEIECLWLYNDGTNPKNDSKCWSEYFEKIKLLSEFEAS